MAIKIGLDAGHGLKTAGKQTPDGIKEWTLNDKVCDKATNYLSAYDCQIIRTDNNEGNVDESLADRLNRYMNAGCKAFVSAHHNAFESKWGNHTGVEVWVDVNATADDLKLAECIYKRLVEYTGLKGRGIKRKNFAVINQNRIAACLVEGGFMDSNIDYKVITSDKGQDAYARAVAEGLIEFCELKEKIVDGWHKDEKGWYYIKNGTKSINRWIEDSQGWCYVGADGYCITSQWRKDSKGWCYIDVNGRAIQNDWAKIGGRWYCFDDNCYAVKGMQTVNGKHYYFAEANYNDIKECQLIITNENGEIQ
jgi:N-acetylmuramoyl-L-alanine amidase